MKVTIEQKKKEAITRMKLLHLHPNVIREFEKDNILNLSESGGFLYWLTDEQKEHVSAFEEEHNALVYDPDVVCQISELLGEIFILE